jgi:hypothetical protein
MIFNCPGSHKFKQPKPEMMKCPYCGGEAELWSDETEARCGTCKKVVARQLGQCCIDWCKYAKECFGEETYSRHKNAGIKKGGN